MWLQIKRRTLANTFKYLGHFLDVPMDSGSWRTSFINTSKRCLSCLSNMSGSSPGTGNRTMISLDSYSNNFFTRENFKSRRNLFIRLYSNDGNWNRFQSPPGQHRNQERWNEPREGDDKIRRFRKKLWYLVRVILLGTGVIVWVALFVAYLSVEEVKIQEVRSDDDTDVKLRAMIFYDIKRLSGRKNFKKAIESQDELEKIFSQEDVKEEMFLKGAALMQVLDRLSREESIASRFGDPMHISGYRCARILAQRLKNEFQENHNPNFWRAQCFVEGPLAAGSLSLTFEREDKNGEWVPTSVHLESMEESGDILCDVARPLPLGLKNFTRFSK